MRPPLVVDIDGTLTGPDRAVDPRVFEILGSWPEPVVVATGKALPYPVALCEFVGIEPTVIAENGGVAYVGATDELLYQGDGNAAVAVVETYEEMGYDVGWGESDLANRWRETEVAVSREAPLEPLRDVAADHGLEVVDTGFAYHVKSTAISKGRALAAVADQLGRDTGEFVAVGDSVNDVSTFGVAGRSFAVGNADDPARAAADEVVEESYADGFLAVADQLTADE